MSGGLRSGDDFTGGATRMFTIKEIEYIRGQQLELRTRKDPLFSEAVLHACDSALAVQRKARSTGDGATKTPRQDYWWNMD